VNVCCRDLGLLLALGAGLCSVTAAMPEYQLAATQQSEDLERQASETFEEGKAANQQSDGYILNAVILASVLFLAGIAPRFEWLPVRLAIVVVAMVFFGLGLYNIAAYSVS
jgi:phage shock protein PspC (stress-responsive transcriptional regulator)